MGIQKPQTMQMGNAQNGGGEFKNSLEALLAKGNPMAIGFKKQPTVVKQEENEEEREKIKFDIFLDNDGEAPELDNVSIV